MEGVLNSRDLVGDTLSEALHVLAGDVCLHVNPGLLDRCRKLVLPSVCSAVPPDAACTWLCEGAHFFTLFRPSGAVGTVIFSHTNEVLYHASMDAQLSEACQADLSFLCQFTRDPTPEGAVPRLLVFDIVSSQPPEARGETLRNLLVHLPQPLCCVQWIGPRRYLSSEFIAGLPHKVGGLIALGDDPALPWPGAAVTRRRRGMAAP